MGQAGVGQGALLLAGPGRAILHDGTLPVISSSRAITWLALISSDPPIL